MDGVQIRFCGIPPKILKTPKKQLTHQLLFPLDWRTQKYA